MVDIPDKLFQKLMQSLPMVIHKIENQNLMFIEDIFNELMEVVKNNTFYVVYKNKITHAITSVRFFNYIDAQNYCDSMRQNYAVDACVVSPKDLVKTFTEYATE